MRLFRKPEAKSATQMAAISGWLGARVEGGIVPDLNSVTAFQNDLANQWARINAASFLTIDEKRQLAGVG